MARALSVSRTADFFSGWRFPVIALTLLIGCGAVSVGLMLMPASDTAAAHFAAQFRVWCFGWEAARGVTRVGPLLAMVGQPLMLAAGIVLVWGGPLRQALHEKRLAVAGEVGIGLAIVTLLTFALMRMTPAAALSLDFPAEDLRTAVPAPVMKLTTQRGEDFTMSSTRGRVVMLTAVYAQCGYTCPRILAEVRRALDVMSPSERARLQVVAVTLDPENDTPEVLRSLAARHGFRDDEVTFLTGPVDRVAIALEGLGIRYRRDPKTGGIDHANMFVLVDAQGRVAYRFTMEEPGDTQERWLQEALHLLAAEAR